MSDLANSLEVTRLAEFVNKIQDIASAPKMMAPTLLRDFIIGQDVANNMLSSAIQADAKAKHKVDYLESIAYLEKAKQYLDSRGIKDTSEARKQYVSIDADVMRAKDERAHTEALVVLLKGKLNQLRQAHDDIKRIAYDKGTETSWEGM